MIIFERYFVIIFCFLTISSGFAQVGIVTTTPQGQLDVVTADDLGFILPRVSNVENVTDGAGGGPINGTVVYDLSRNATCFYTNGSWICITPDGSGSVTITDESAPPIPSSADYIKSSNTQTSDFFGFSAAVSADGSTMAIGATGEDSNAVGIGGNQTNNSRSFSGAVYIYIPGVVVIGFFKNT